MQAGDAAAMGILKNLGGQGNINLLARLISAETGEPYTGQVAVGGRAEPD